MASFLEQLHTTFPALAAVAAVFWNDDVNPPAGVCASAESVRRYARRHIFLQP
jgi:hypothetical protein